MAQPLEVTSTSDHTPRFLISIDTEGDDLWAKPREITTKNAEHLPRFQALCESYGLRPTYLANHEMAVSRSFQEFGKDLVGRDAGEIGMHLHAWNSPPLIPLTTDDFAVQPYLVAYPEPVIEQKVVFLTKLLEDTFSVKMVSHRAGKWVLDETYARVLVAAGYEVDTSVTPHLTWPSDLARAKCRGGRDYSHYPRKAYFVDLDDLSRPGASTLLEVPVTIRRTRRRSGSAVHELLQGVPGTSYPRRVLRRLFPEVEWLRPNGRNRSAMLEIVSVALAANERYVNLALHSSELMPGGSPRFRTKRQVESLYRDLEAVFSSAEGDFAGSTLTEFHRHQSAQRASRVGADDIS